MPFVHSLIPKLIVVREILYWKQNKKDTTPQTMQRGNFKMLLHFYVIFTITSLRRKQISFHSVVLNAQICIPFSLSFVTLYHLQWILPETTPRPIYRSIKSVLITNELQMEDFIKRDVNMITLAKLRRWCRFTAF